MSDSADSRNGDRHLRRAGGQARDAFGQTVEHGHGGVLGRLVLCCNIVGVSAASAAASAAAFNFV